MLKKSEHGRGRYRNTKVQLKQVKQKLSELKKLYGKFRFGGVGDDSDMLWTRFF